MPDIAGTVNLNLVPDQNHRLEDSERQPNDTLIRMDILKKKKKNQKTKKQNNQTKKKPCNSVELIP